MDARYKPNCIHCQHHKTSWRYLALGCGKMIWLLVWTQDMIHWRVHPFFLFFPQKAISTYLIFSSMQPDGKSDTANGHWLMNLQRSIWRRPSMLSASIITNSIDSRISSTSCGLNEHPHKDELYRTPSLKIKRNLLNFLSIETPHLFKNSSNLQCYRRSVVYKITWNPASPRSRSLPCPTGIESNIPQRELD